MSMCFFLTWEFMNLNFNIKSVFCLILTLSSFIGLGQDFEAKTDNYSIPGIDQLVQVPASPEAEAFTKYGNAPVSLYTGTPDIGIPLGTLKGRKFQVPINLSYDASGIKVEQIATNVGLGWNLQLGGVITRKVNGLPDDYKEAIPAYSRHYQRDSFVGKSRFQKYIEVTPNEGQVLARGTVEDHHSYLRDQQERKIDSEPDTYSFSAPGLSGTLYIDYGIPSIYEGRVVYGSAKAYCHEHPELKIEPIMAPEIGFSFNTPVIPGDFKDGSVKGWKITDGKGVKYTFTESETTKITDPDETVEFISAWHLTEIETPGSQDKVTLSYTKTGYWQNKQLGGRDIIRREKLENGCAPSLNSISRSRDYQVNQPRLNFVYLNDRMALRLHYHSNSRLDLLGRHALSSLEILNRKGDRLNKIQFGQTYFETQNPLTELDYRLRLDEVKIFGQRDTDFKVFNLEYYEGYLPSRNSFAQDYWGYYNGQVNPQTLIPANPLFDDESFLGQDRKPSLYHSRIGTLRKLNYPTGGFTEFSYKLHKKSASSGATTTYEEQYLAGSVGLIGGHDPNDTHGYTSCFVNEIYPDIPLGKDSQFTIEQDGWVDISMNLYGESNPQEQLAVFAAIRKTGDLCDNGTPICPAGPSWDFCELFSADLPFKKHGNFDAGYYVNEPAFLEAGYYQIKLLNARPNTTLALQVVAKRTVTKSIHETDELDIGGLRIHRIQDFSKNDHVAQTRYLYYGDLSLVHPSQITESFLEASAATTGVDHQPLQFESYYSTIQGDRTCRILNRHSNNLFKVNGPHITYSQVTEVQFGEDKINGMQVHDFHNDRKVSFFSPIGPVRPLNGKSFRNRIFKYDEANDELDLVQEELKQYSDRQIDRFVLKGINVHSVGIFPQYYVVTDLGFDPAFHGNIESFKLKTAFYGGLHNPPHGTDTGVTLNWQYCAFDDDYPDYPDDNIFCIEGPLSLPEKRIYALGSHWTRMDNRTVRTYDENGNSISISTDFEYKEDANHFQPVKIINYNSDGSRLKRKRYYLEDYPEEMAHLRGRNMVTTIIREEVEFDEMEIFSTQFGFVNNNFLPNTYSFGFGEEEELRIQIKRDEFQNPIELVKDKGAPFSFIWGYNHTKLIAQIQNATADEVQELLDEHNWPSLQADEILESDFMATINGLKEELTNSQITAYRYKPGVGVAQVIAVNGLSSYYKYDDLNRLNHVLDHNGNYLNTHFYSYANKFHQNITYREEQNVPYTLSMAAQASVDQVMVATQYVDGLGRPEQTVTKQASPSSKDIVQLFVYDAFGRELKKYLPYTSEMNGSRKVDALEAQQAFYGPEGDYAYQEQVVELSPLNRTLAQHAPGEAWSRAGDGRAVETIYRTNSLDEEVIQWRMIEGEFAFDGFYAFDESSNEGSLFVMEVYDENGFGSFQYKDKLGRTVLNKQQVDESTFLSTYFIYDDLNNLRFVIQPEGVRQFLSQENTSVTKDLIKQYCFVYEYDHRNRMTMKKVPGTEASYMVYDLNDRLILSQQGNDRTQSGDDTNNAHLELIDTNLEVSQYEGQSYVLLNKNSGRLSDGFYFSSSGGESFRLTSDEAAYSSDWNFTKYDVFDRTVQSGRVTLPGNRKTVQNLVNEESQLSEESLEADGLMLYSNQAFPRDIDQSNLLTVSYYDDYRFTDGVSPLDEPTPTWGLATGAKIRILGSDEFLTSASFYDTQLRVIKTVSENHLGGEDVVINTYDSELLPNIDQSVRIHTANDATTEITEVFDYDHTDRLLSIDHQVTGQRSILLLNNQFNERGELVNKLLSDNELSTSYRYNLRGWMMHINNGTTFDSPNDVFGMELLYDAAGQFNGNIGQMKWKTIGGNGVFNGEQALFYTYDGANRLKTGIYTGQGNDLFNVGGDDSGIRYDNNGNILNLVRWFQGDVADDLIYGYRGNQLMSVGDQAQGDPELLFLDGNTEGDDYDYDTNGNMFMDLNKKITSISYNHLNLPEQVITTDGEGQIVTINYTYNAAGMKLRKSVTVNDHTTISDYVGGFHYVDNDLKFFQHAEGRAIRNGDFFAYEFNMVDHLGNVRASVNQFGALKQRDDYYPYGLTYNTWSDGGKKNNYKFQGQEHQDETGWDQYKWRNADPSIGRFFNVDPLAEDYHFWTPYAFSGNMVTNNIELEGLEPTSPEYMWASSSGYRNYGDQYRDGGVLHRVEGYWVHGTQTRNGNQWRYYNGKSWQNFTPAQPKPLEDDVRMIATRSISVAAIGVAGGVLMESGGAYLVNEYAPAIWKHIHTQGPVFNREIGKALTNMFIDGLNQFVIKDGDFNEIDWANVVASGFIKHKGLKNLIQSAIDIKGDGFDPKDFDDVLIEFFIRTTADITFSSVSDLSKQSKSNQFYFDFFKKKFREFLKDDIVNPLTGKEKGDNSAEK